MRIFFNHQAVIENRIIHTTSCDDAGDNCEYHIAEEPRLFGLTYRSMLRHIGRELQPYGIVVTLAAHRLTPETEGLGWWQSNEHGMPISDVKRSWALLATDLCHGANVVSVGVGIAPYGLAPR